METTLIEPVKSVRTIQPQAGCGECAKSLRPPGLLETVQHLRAQVGDGLDDEEFSFFAFRREIPTEEGFGFLCFHDECVTLTVPVQQDVAWHPPGGWLLAAKEDLAAGFARKHHLYCSEPPDAPGFLILAGDQEIHHHIRFSNCRDTVIIAHPAYLKIRLYAPGTHIPLPQAPGLLRDLAALYRPS